MKFFFKKLDTIKEENIEIPIYGKDISKKLTVFYNPDMKLNRDISLLVIKSYFTKKIKFCDPMIASGIREVRFLKTIPEMFETMVLGDISKTAIKNAKRNFKKNNISTRQCLFVNSNAVDTINKDYFDFIEIDPYGSPVPFLDIACQRIKHNGILSVTATDTAALCGTYPKTTLRKYGIKVNRTLFYEELGLRNLIAYVQRQGAKYEKNLIPIISYSKLHYYKIFFKVEESRTKSWESVYNHSWVEVDEKTQEITILKQQSKNSLGRTYTGSLNDVNFIQTLNVDLLKDNKKAKSLIEKLMQEIDAVGSYNIHMLKKKFKIKENKSFNDIIENLSKLGFESSFTHNGKFNIKTKASSQDLVKVLQAKD